MTMVVDFASAWEQVDIAAVGGKARSLLRLSQMGFQVPAGFVLTTHFFNPWLDTLKTETSWSQLLDHDDLGDETATGILNQLKTQAQQLTFTEAQTASLEKALSQLPASHYAVRSSSPEEDLSTASFAGIYDTRLGVQPDQIHQAIRAVFASCLDQRVFLYKAQNKLPLDSHHMAIIVMTQLDSTVSGVSFSINPITNDYDECVISANWGLGESVVSGLSAPDAYVIDKLTRSIKTQEMGQKSLVYRLNDTGGISTEMRGQQNDWSLQPPQVLAILDAQQKIDAAYGRPMDIEWAFVEDQLWLLQARPITTWIPLPRGLETKPDEPRRLYADITLSVQGLQKPLSYLSCDFFQHFMPTFMQTIFGHADPFDPINGVVTVRDGKMMVNVSNIFKNWGRDRFGQHFKKLDTLAGQAMLDLDETELAAYTPESRPSGVRFNPLKVLWRLKDVFFNILTGPYRLKRIAAQYETGVTEFFEAFNQISLADGNISSLLETWMPRFTHLGVHRLALPLVIGRRALGEIKALFEVDAKQDPETKRQLEQLTRSFPHNVTVEMGLTVYQLSQQLSADDYPTLEALMQGYHDQTLPSEFYAAWETFMHRFGPRGADELDIANPRYRDDPSQLLRQVHGALTTCEDHNPQAVYDAAVAAREAAYHYFLKLAFAKGGGVARKFKRIYQAMVAFAGYRENHKLWLMHVVAKFRSLALEVGQQMVGQGLLVSADEVFQLSFARLSDFSQCTREQLLAEMADNNQVIDQLRQVKQPPALIDSRGRILRAKRKTLGEGEVGGEPVSPGVIRGRAKIMPTPDAQTLAPGDILVARVTDPGWTPLFINAGAIVLEVGGLLQHGALVAREYGKPCVAGVRDVMDLLENDEMIEVDGASGVIRRLSQVETESVA